MMISIEQLGYNYPFHLIFGIIILSTTRYIQNEDTHNFCTLQLLVETLGHSTYQPINQKSKVLS